jgi:hypothetical protein
MIAERLRPPPKTWGHDRSETVGASEIGQCARQTWYSKHGYQPEGEQSWGPAERGHMVEAWVTAKLGAVMELTRVQQTLFDGPLSATLDMVIPVEMPLDVKSFDPRTADPLKPKHLMQLQVQMGMIEAHQGMLLYVNAADFSDVREIVYDFDPAVYNAALVRADRILTSPVPPEREGVWTGECKWCPFQGECKGPVPSGEGAISGHAVTRLKALRAAAEITSNLIEMSKRTLAQTNEQAIEILRAADVRRVPGVVAVHGAGLRWNRESE